MAMKKKGYRRGGKVKKMMKGGAAGGRKMRMMKKGGAAGGKIKKMTRGGATMKSKGGRSGGIALKPAKSKNMTLAQLRAAAKKMGYKVTRV